MRKRICQPLIHKRIDKPQKPLISIFLLVLALLISGSAVVAQDMDSNEPGILEPVTSYLQSKEIRVPNTDQSIDGVEQSTIHGAAVIESAAGATSLLGHTITRVTSPNEDMRQTLQALTGAAQAANEAEMRAAAEELMAILLGTTEGRIYDGYGMLNFNRWKDNRIGPQHFPADAIEGEYKMKWARDTGETFISPFDDQERKIWEVDISMLYYDGQIDSDTFLLRFPVDTHPDDTLRVNYRIYSLVLEDFSPTAVTLDRRQAGNTVQFPFKGFDAVWIEMKPGEVLNVSVNYPPARQFRGVYTWGWREHPPRIQFLQPLFDIVNVHTNEVELEPQSYSYAYRNREDLTLETIGAVAPEKKMYITAQAVLDGAEPLTIFRWLTETDQGPLGTWIDWADLATEQRQLPLEARQLLEAEGIGPGEYGDYDMISVFVNNEMYGEGNYENEVLGWDQGDTFKVKLINFDEHTHYFRNVDFGTRLHDDISRCCAGGQTSFEVMNFKPSYGAPKVGEMQWRAGWGFRPHYDVIQQQDVFSRGSDRVKLTPYLGGEGGLYFGYQYSEEARGGDFRFNPPNFVIGFDAANPSTDRLRDVDGEEGLVIGQFTEGYGVAQVCPNDPYPGFCSKDIRAFNPLGSANVDSDGDGVNDELHFPPFLRTPAQGIEGAGDIIPPTGAWETFTWINPDNGTLFLDPEDESKGYWADLTYAHGAPVYANSALNATIELPRASGQVFYQFDDLFHDNNIFSPHPLFEGIDEDDEIVHLNGFIRNFLRIRGRVSSLSDGQHSEWVALYAGAAGENGCVGEPLAAAPVDPSRDGLFVFRCGEQDRCSAPALRQESKMFGGFKFCVQSSVGGYRDFTVVE